MSAHLTERTRRNAARAALLATPLALALGCASDVWFKPGASNDDLARDKAACRAEVGSDGNAQAATEAFEACMEGKRWWHAVRGTPEPTVAAAPAARPRGATSARPSSGDTRPAPRAAESPAAAGSAPSAAAPGAGTALSPSGGSALPPVGAGRASNEDEVIPETFGDTEAPTEDAYAPGGDAVTEPWDVELESQAVPEAPAAVPADPKARQFWFKLGAGPGVLETEQRACRADMGADPDATAPSRWGESEAFDQCMRGRGWAGGAVSRTAR
jgi:hypothetical protein